MIGEVLDFVISKLTPLFYKKILGGQDESKSNN